MATNTTKLGLLKPSENDFYNQQTEQADNWDKVDKFADDIQNLVDNNSGKKISGYIQDEGEKVLGNYYLDKLTTGLFKCIKTGIINYNSSEYFVDYSNYSNGDKLQKLTKPSVVLLGYAFHPVGTKANIPPDCRYISIYYARTTGGETIRDSTMIPISSLRIMSHSIQKNLYFSSNNSFSLLSLTIDTSLEITILNNNFGILIVGHY